MGDKVGRLPAADAAVTASPGLGAEPASGLGPEGRVPHGAWQPIETAPKDGTWFVALQYGETYPCSWEREEPDEGPPAEGWFDYFNRSFEEPTHWMPLPEPPVQP